MTGQAKSSINIRDITSCLFDVTKLTANWYISSSVVNPEDCNCDIIECDFDIEYDMGDDINV
jgi:hypothetical protein